MYMEKIKNSEFSFVILDFLKTIDELKKTIKENILLKKINEFPDNVELVEISSSGTVFSYLNHKYLHSQRLL